MSLALLTSLKPQRTADQAVGLSYNRLRCCLGFFEREVFMRRNAAETFYPPYVHERRDE